LSRCRLAVLFGGVSPEHEVSCLSAGSVIDNLDPDKYEIIKIGIAKAGHLFLFEGSTDAVRDGNWEAGAKTRLYLAADRDMPLFSIGEGGAIALPVDCFFPVLHGANGEDGTIQGLFELTGIPYVGCGVAASANCMDKSITKVLARAAGVPQADYLVYHRVQTSFADMADESEERFGFPVFVKPTSTGSSVGISKAHDRAGLLAALEEAFRFGDRLLIEEFIEGRELETAVLGRRQIVVSDVGEILPSREFYTYESKYVDGTSGLVIPADIPEDSRQEVRRLAEMVYRALGCEGLARVDFFLRPGGRPVFNEINTLPGFTAISMYPKLMEQAGVPYPELLDRLVACALERGA